MEICSQIARFTEEGWRVRYYTLTAKQMYVDGPLLALPFTAFACGVYRILLPSRAALSAHNGYILAAAVILSLIAHELLHGFGWKLAGRLENHEIKFRFRLGMSVCVCQAVLSTKAYLLGLLLPFFVLGGGSMLFLMVYPGALSLLTASVNLLMPGADLLAVWMILRSGAARIAGDPDRNGFIGLYLYAT